MAHQSLKHEHHHQCVPLSLGNHSQRKHFGNYGHLEKVGHQSRIQWHHYHGATLGCQWQILAPHQLMLLELTHSCSFPLLSSANFHSIPGSQHLKYKFQLFSPLVLDGSLSPYNSPLSVAQKSEHLILVCGKHPLEVCCHGLHHLL